MANAPPVLVACNPDFFLEVECIPRANQSSMNVGTDLLTKTWTGHAPMPNEGGGMSDTSSRRWLFLGIVTSRFDAFHLLGDLGIISMEEWVFKRSL